MNNIFHVDIVRSDFKLMRLLLSKQATYDMLFGICFQNSVLACVVQFMNYNLENVPKCVNMNEKYQHYKHEFSQLFEQMPKNQQLIVLEFF